MPLVSDVHVDAMLSNLSVKYRNAAYIADRVMPAIPVAHESDQYWIFGKENFMIPETLRAPNAPAARVEWSLSDDSYTALEYALASPIGRRERDNADDGLNLEISTTEYVTDMLLLDREVRVAGIAQDTGTFTAAEPNPNWDEAACTPVEDVMAASEAMRLAVGRRPNLMVLPAAVLYTLKSAAAIIDQVKYTSDGRVTLELLRRLFEIDNILVPEAQKNTAAEGETESMSDVWTDTVGLYYVNPAAQQKTVTMGHTFRARPFRTRKWDEDDTEATIVEVSMIDAEKVVCAGAGYLLNNCNA